ncbi:hypothetical protein MLP_53520 [Microlunatus phosphovorus NM-1]|uniref:Uncharacterized protein n=1 Tax=Microlunatus phosphovorus (strain ATCC 700054 / DSM 10555 / JCM 9379 / NBRC 101784 / NCIMB 13414 / VKM Ac-1990 / NM-1) TaxID=1032480 RepID=F5XJU8_MICPN|nr:hypothetical protein MLP_53520 [Microlunatus phosphovorus NM-1]
MKRLPPHSTPHPKEHGRQHPANPGEMVDVVANPANPDAW